MDTTCKCGKPASPLYNGQCESCYTDGMASKLANKIMLKIVVTLQIIGLVAYLLMWLMSLK